MSDTAGRSGAQQGAAWPPGDGEVARLIRERDWSKNPLGPTATWPQSLRTIVEFTLASPLPTKLIWGPDLIQLYNDAFAAIIGDKHPTGLGQRVTECWAEIMHLSAPQYARALTGETVIVHNQDWKILRRGVEDVSFMAYLTPLRTETGQIAGLHIVIKETTEQLKAEKERELAEQALRYSETRLQAAADVVGLGCYAWDLRTETPFLDFRARRMWGFPPEMRLDRDAVRARIVAEDRTRVDAAMAKALDPAGNGMFECEYRIRRLEDDAERWLKARGRTTFADGKPVDFLGVAQDITERKRADLAVRASEARMRGILEQLPMGIGVFDLRGGLQLANGLFRRYVEALSSRERNTSGVSPSWWVAALNGEAVFPGMDVLLTSDDGKPLRMRLSAAPMYGRDGAISGAIAIVQDRERPPAEPFLPKTGLYEEEPLPAAPMTFL